MDKQAQALALAEQLLEDVELSRLPIGQLVLKATRLARLMEDETALVWLGFESRGVPGSDAGKRYMTKTGRWTNQENGEGYWQSIGAIQAVIDSGGKAVGALKVDSVSGESVSIALREQRKAILSLSSQSTTMVDIVTRVAGLVHEFAMRVYLELQFSDAQAAMFESARQGVDARLALLGGDALTKIESINERFRNGDPEAVSHAMTTARRLIDSVADAVFPGRVEPYMIGEESIAVGDSKVLNRISAFLNECGVTKGRRTRIRRTLGDIYDRVSKGVHDDVDVDEARFVFLSTYVTLGEVVSLSPRVNA